MWDDPRQRTGARDARRVRRSAVPLVGALRPEALPQTVRRYERSGGLLLVFCGLDFWRRVSVRGGYGRRGRRAGPAARVDRPMYGNQGRRTPAMRPTPTRAPSGRDPRVDVGSRAHRAHPPGAQAQLAQAQALARQFRPAEHARVPASIAQGWRRVISTRRASTAGRSAKRSKSCWRGGRASAAYARATTMSFVNAPATQAPPILTSPRWSAAR